MPSNVFNPELTQVDSSVTPTEGIPNTGAVELFADVAQVATEAAFSFAGQQELGELKRKFSNIAQARQQGGNASTLSARARSALAEAKANSPYISRQADELFNTTFGKGGTGVFAKTAAEKAQDDYIQEVEETALQLGISQEEAQKRIALVKDANDAKVLAGKQKEVREYNGDLVFTSVQKTTNVASISMMDALQRGMERGGGSLSTEDKRGLISTIENQRLSMMADLNSDSKDPNTGHLLISKSLYQDSLNAIDKWAEDSRRIINDNAYSKLIGEANTAKQAEVNLIAATKYPVLKMLESAGGQAAVQGYLSAVRRGEGAAKEFLKRSHPAISDAFEQQGSFTKAAEGGTDKLMLGSGKPTPMTQNEAYATGTVLLDPANNALRTTTMSEVSKEEGKIAHYKEMIVQNPDASKLAWDERYRTFVQANKAEAAVIGANTISALRSAFLGAYVKENESLSPIFNFPEPTQEQLVGASSVGRAGLLSTDTKFSISGEGITPEMASIIMNAKRTLDANPSVLDSLSKKAGQPLSSTQGVIYSFTGRLPEERVDTEELSGDIPKKKIEEDPKKKPAEATLSEEGLRMKGLLDEGAEPDKIEGMIDNLGLAEPAKERMRKALQEAVNAS